MYGYRSRALLDLPFTMQTHDPVNTKSVNIGRGGSALDAVFGAGAASPTKLTYRRGYSFDGGDYMNCSNDAAVQLTTKGTVAALFRDNDFPTPGTGYDYYRHLVMKGNIYVTGFNGYGLYIRYADPNITLRVVVANAAARITVSDLMLPRRYNQITLAVGTWSTTGVYLYLNGMLSNSGAAGDATNDGVGLAIGASNPAVPVAYANGPIYWAGVWDFALTPLEVADLYQNLLKEVNVI